jgi:copper homeostasis protein
LAEVRSAVNLPIIAMVRARAGNFCFGQREQCVMLRDAELLLAGGAAGVACGALTINGDIDRAFWKRLVQTAAGREVVFHRAFDVMQNQLKAIDVLVDLGTTRVLTSGGAATALAGAAHLAKLVTQSAGRIEILPAAGISAEHIGELLRTTGCQQVHGSFRELNADRPHTSPARVAAARAALDACEC